MTFCSPCHWNNGVFTGLFLSKDQTDDNLMTQGQDCSVDAATLYPEFVMASAVHTLLCGLALSYRGNNSYIFIVE